MWIDVVKTLEDFISTLGRIFYWSQLSLNGIQDNECPLQGPSGGWSGRERTAQEEDKKRTGREDLEDSHCFIFHPSCKEKHSVFLGQPPSAVLCPLYPGELSVHPISGMCFPGLAGLHCILPEQVQLQEHSCDPHWVSRNLGDPILREGTSHFPLDLKQVGCKPGAVGAMLSSQRETGCTSAFLPPFLKQNKQTNWKTENIGAELQRD